MIITLIRTIFLRQELMALLIIAESCMLIVYISLFIRWSAVESLRYALFILVLAAIEARVGLSIIVMIIRNTSADIIRIKCF